MTASTNKKHAHHPSSSQRPPPLSFTREEVQDFLEMLSDASSQWVNSKYAAGNMYDQRPSMDVPELVDDLVARGESLLAFKVFAWQKACSEMIEAVRESDGEKHFLIPRKK